MSNTRIIEKDINILDPDEVGGSDVVDLNRASKFSCQAVYTVDTPVNATITFQGSNDATNWTNLQSATAISADGTVTFEEANASYRYFRVLKALDSGDVTLSLLTLVLGDNI